MPAHGHATAVATREKNKNASQKIAAVTKPAVATPATAAPAHKGLDPRRRFKVVDASRFVTTVRTDKLSQPEEFTAELLVISKSGARLVVPRTIPLGEVTCSIESPELGLRTMMDGRATLARPRDDGSWTIECKFDVHFPDHALESMLDADLLERREAERVPASIPASIRWEGQSTREPATLCDVSKGGFCLRAKKGGPTGNRLRLILPQQDPGTVLAVRSQWVVKRDGDFLVGCEFINSRDYCFVAPYFKQHQQQPVLPVERVSRFRQLFRFVTGSN